MSSFNQVILVGNVGRDAECRTISDGATKVANIAVATTQRGYTRKSGEVVEPRTEWHKVVLWRHLAEVAEKYVKKGTQVQVIGELRTREYQDKDGQTRYTTEIMASQLLLLGKASQKGEGASAQPTTPATPAPEQKKVEHQQPFEGSSADMDELPF